MGCGNQPPPQALNYVQGFLYFPSYFTLASHLSEIIRWVVPYSQSPRYLVGSQNLAVTYYLVKELLSINVIPNYLVRHTLNLTLRVVNQPVAIVI